MSPQEYNNYQPDSEAAVTRIWFHGMMQGLHILEQTGPFLNRGTPDDAVAARVEDQLNNIVNLRPDLLEEELVARYLKKLNIYFVEIEPDEWTASSKAVKDLRYLGAAGMRVTATVAA